VKLERLRKLQIKVESNVRKEVDTLVEKWKDEEGSLILILHEIENQHGYVPRRSRWRCRTRSGSSCAHLRGPDLLPLLQTEAPGAITWPSAWDRVLPQGGVRDARRGQEPAQGREAAPPPTASGTSMSCAASAAAA